MLDEEDDVGADVHPWPRWPLAHLDEEDDVGADVHPWPRSPIANLDVQRDVLKKLLLRGTSMFVISPDGTRIAYDIQGEGTPLILLAGFDEPRTLWHRIGYVDRLKPHFQVITIDRRGIGESDRPGEPGAYIVEKMLDDIYCVADACQLANFAAWGHSFGGSQVLQLAARSARVTRAIVAGSFFGQVYPVKRITPIVAELTELLQAQQQGRLEQLGLSPEEIVSFQPQDIEAMAACWQALVGWPILEPQEVRCPLLIYTGAADERVAQPLRQRQQEIEHAGIVLHIFKNMNHEQEVSKIDIVFESVSGFLMLPAR
jgi:pimeloyl-ACP methyl ester carboxylesterase